MDRSVSRYPEFARLSACGEKRIVRASANHRCIRAGFASRTHHQSCPTISALLVDAGKQPGQHVLVSDRRHDNNDPAPACSDVSKRHRTTSKRFVGHMKNGVETSLQLFSDRPSPPFVCLIDHYSHLFRHFIPAFQSPLCDVQERTTPIRLAVIYAPKRHLSSPTPPGNF